VLERELAELRSERDELRARLAQPQPSETLHHPRDYKPVMWGKCFSSSCSSTVGAERRRSVSNSYSMTI
jgi:hypothetical protein